MGISVSQRSVEKLFRWGGKRLKDLEPNLFRKWRSKFRQHCPSFVEYITKTFRSLFFTGHMQSGPK